MGKKFRKNKWKGKYHAGRRPKKNKKSVKEKHRLSLLQDNLLNEYFRNQQRNN